MQRFVVHRIADGLVLRHGYVDAVEGLGTFDPATEAAVVDPAVFDATRFYVWDGVGFADAGPRIDSVRFHASSTRADGVDVVVGPTWTVIERTFTTAGFFTRRQSYAVAHSVGMIATTGGAAELRIVEDPGHDIGGGVREYTGADDRVLTDAGGAGFVALPDSSGAFRAFNLASDQPLTLTDYQAEYRLEARLGTAVSATMRAPSLALLERTGLGAV